MIIHIYEIEVKFKYLVISASLHNQGVLKICSLPMKVPFVKSYQHQEFRSLISEVITEHFQGVVKCVPLHSLVSREHEVLVWIFALGQGLLLTSDIDCT